VPQPAPQVTTPTGGVRVTATTGFSQVANPSAATTPSPVILAPCCGTEQKEGEADSISNPSQKDDQQDGDKRSPTMSDSLAANAGAVPSANSSEKNDNQNSNQHSSTIGDVFAVADLIQQNQR
jgi:hypothetical protein